MNSKTLRTIFFALTVGTFLVPLIVVPASFIFPFIVPKILTFRTLVACMAASYILLLIGQRSDYRIRFTPISVSVGLFLLSFAISTFAGVDWYHSFWDNHERMLGLFTVFHYVLYFYLLTSVYRSWREWQWLLRLFLMAGSVVMILGCAQMYNPYFLLNQGSFRVASTLGNSIYVGGYGLFLIWVAYLLALKETSKGWLFAEVFAGVLAVLGLLFSGSRGALIGLLTGGLFLLVSYMFVLKNNPKIRVGIAILLTLGLLTGGFLYANRTKPWVANIPAVGRTLNSGLTDTVQSPRWIAWQIAWEGWEEKPVFGWGPNNYFYAFNKYYHPRSLEFGYGETWFDNAHNIIMNTLAVQGAFGLLCYLSIFVTALYSVFRAYRRRSLDLHIALIGCAFLIAHLVQNVTVFENPTSYLYFMFWLAFVNQMSMVKSDAAGATAPAPVIKKSSPGLTGFVAVVALLWVVIFNYQPARANMDALEVFQVITQVNPQTFSKIQDVLNSHSPHIDDIRNDVSRTIVEMVTNNLSQIGAEQGNNYLSLARTALTENTKLHPYDIRTYLLLAQLEQISAQLNANASYLESADKNLEQALSYSPKRQQIMYALAWIRAQRGDVKSAITYLNQALEEDPLIGESYWRLMFILKNIGMDKEMRTVWNLAQANNANFSDQEMATVNSLLAQPAPTTTPTKKK